MPRLKRQAQPRNHNEKSEYNQKRDDLFQNSMKRLRAKIIPLYFTADLFRCICLPLIRQILRLGGINVFDCSEDIMRSCKPDPVTVLDLIMDLLQMFG